MESLVALDIETTGLDPDKDAIIEIGAVRFNDHQIEDTWSTLINPGRRLPPFITQLTGIRDSMLVQSPSIHEVLPELSQFVGSSPVVGHNVRFDLGFLRRYNILRRNDSLDTYEMAGVLLPTADRYNLGALALALDVPLPARHRALDDAQTTRGIFLKLYEEALALPLPLLADLVRLSEPVEWGGYLPLQMALRQRSRETVGHARDSIAAALTRTSSQPFGEGLVGPLFKEQRRPIAPLQPKEKLTPLDLDEVSAILEPGGAFSYHFPNYEFRSQQVEMLRSVSDALSNGKHLMIEAGTGTGKSIAYLIPAAIWALQNNCRVVISTNTKNLQDQLYSKDIPDLCAALGINLRAVKLKGRANYLCPRRLNNLLRRGPETADEMRVLGKVKVWLQGSTSGDRDEINLNGPVENQVWSKINADDEGCNNENCLKHTGGTCPFFRIRQEAQSAHLLIVNHALLLADIATGNRVLPEYDYLIVDEAHHLEAATTGALSFDTTQWDVERTLRELGGPKAGVLGRLLTAAQGIIAPLEYASLNELVNRATDMAFRLESQTKEFFQCVERFLGDQREGRPMGQYSHQERILPATRTQPAWGDVELAWDELQRGIAPLIDLVAKLSQGLFEIVDVLKEGDEEIYGNLTNLLRRLKDFHDNITALVFKPDDDKVYWAESQSNNYRVSLHAAPLHIGPLMDKHLWREKTSIILTSATLTTAGDFDYLRGRLSAVDAYELALGSPFDFENSALLYLVNDIPEPSDRQGHQQAIERGIVALCKETGGRALVLFTSYDQLKRTSATIAPYLARESISILEQGEGASAHSLLETFRNSERAVLLGTRAFWEGVDVPGQALSVLVIVKLPFDVPSDPIVAARSETFEDAFYQYQLPEAILRFRQGFGRLIRTQLDHGVVAVLDKRILTKRYGHLFTDSIPTCTVRKGPLASLPLAAKQWLNL